MSEAAAPIAQLHQLNLRLVAEVDDRDLPACSGARSIRAWLRHKLRLSPAAAKPAQLLAQRLAHSCPTTAAALADGRVDLDQAGVITRTVDELPNDTDRAMVDSAEAWLVDRAGSFDAAALAQLGEHVLEVIDPDGAEDRLADQVRREEARYARRDLPDRAGPPSTQHRRAPHRRWRAATSDHHDRLPTPAHPGGHGHPRHRRHRQRRQHPAAIDHPPGATATTSPTGSTAAPPASTTPGFCAATITGYSTRASGPSGSATTSSPKSFH